MNDFFQMKVNPLTDCQKYVIRITLKPLEMRRDTFEYELHLSAERPFAPFSIQSGVLSGEENEKEMWHVFYC